MQGVRHYGMLIKEQSSVIGQEQRGEESYPFIPEEYAQVHINNQNRYENYNVLDNNSSEMADSRQGVDEAQEYRIQGRPDQATEEALLPKDKSR